MNTSTLQPSPYPARARRCFLAIATALGLTAACSLSATSVGFDQATDFTSNFTETGEAGSTTFSFSSVAGVNGGGGLNVSGSPDSIVGQSPFTGFGAGISSVEVSVFYKARTALGGAANVSIASGLVADPSVKIGLTGAGTGPWLMLTINGLTTASDVTTDFWLSLRSNVGGTSTTSGNSADKFKVTNNNWYKFTSVYTYDADAKTFSATALVEDFGASGTSGTRYDPDLDSVAAGAPADVVAAMAAMNVAGRTIKPSKGKVAAFHDAKHRVFLRMHKDYVGLRNSMK